jgi:hypothetical protein
VKNEGWRILTCESRNEVGRQKIHEGFDALILSQPAGVNRAEWGLLWRKPIGQYLFEALRSEPLSAQKLWQQANAQTRRDRGV